MKKLISAAFAITPFQILWISGLAAVKHWMTISGLAVQLAMPLFIIGAFLGAFLLTGVALSGFLQNNEHTPESWALERPQSKYRKFIKEFIKWSYIIPFVVGYVFAVYMITPTSLSLFFALLIGIILQNVLKFYLKAESPQSDPQN